MIKFVYEPTPDCVKGELHHLHVRGFSLPGNDLRDIFKSLTQFLFLFLFFFTEMT